MGIANVSSSESKVKVFMQQNQVHYLQRRDTFLPRGVEAHLFVNDSSQFLPRCMECRVADAVVAMSFKALTGNNPIQSNEI